LVGEVDFGTQEMWDEWTRFEAIVNVALAPYPLSSVCAYDTGTLPALILTAAQATHPNVLTAAGREQNVGYRDPLAVLRGLRPNPPTAIEADPLRFVTDLTAPADLAGLRRGLRAALTTAGVSSAVIDDVLAAVTETCTNALMHGRPPVSVRVWTSGGVVQCTVTDHGDGFDLPLAGYLPPADPGAAGAGLWLARHTVDRVSSARTPDGFTVRLTRAARTGDNPGRSSRT
jgi:anti-sigma regulatory factor (Ser/Thr protein kinase)